MTDPDRPKPRALPRPLPTSVPGPGEMRGGTFHPGKLDRAIDFGLGLLLFALMVGAFLAVVVGTVLAIPAVWHAVRVAWGAGSP